MFSNLTTITAYHFINFNLDYRAILIFERNAKRNINKRHGFSSKEPIAPNAKRFIYFIYLVNNGNINSSVVAIASGASFHFSSTYLGFHAI